MKITPIQLSNLIFDTNSDSLINALEKYIIDISMENPFFSEDLEEGAKNAIQWIINYHSSMDIISLSTGETIQTIDLWDYEDGEQINLLASDGPYTIEFNRPEKMAMEYCADVKQKIDEMLNMAK